MRKTVFFWGDPHCVTLAGLDFWIPVSHLLGLGSQVQTFMAFQEISDRKSRRGGASEKYKIRWINPETPLTSVETED